MQWWFKNGSYERHNERLKNWPKQDFCEFLSPQTWCTTHIKSKATFSFHLNLTRIIVLWGAVLNVKTQLQSVEFLLQYSPLFFVCSVCIRAIYSANRRYINQYILFNMFTLFDEHSFSISRTTYANRCVGKSHIQTGLASFCAALQLAQRLTT